MFDVSEGTCAKSFIDFRFISLKTKDAIKLFSLKRFGMLGIKVSRLLLAPNPEFVHVLVPNCVNFIADKEDVR